MTHTRLQLDHLILQLFILRLQLVSFLARSGELRSHDLQFVFCLFNLPADLIKFGTIVIIAVCSGIIILRRLMAIFRSAWISSTRSKCVTVVASQGVATGATVGVQAQLSTGRDRGCRRAAVLAGRRRRRHVTIV